MTTEILAAAIRSLLLEVTQYGKGVCMEDREVRPRRRVREAMCPQAYAPHG